MRSSVRALLRQQPWSQDVQPEVCKGIIVTALFMHTLMIFVALSSALCVPLSDNSMLVTGAIAYEHAYMHLELHRCCIA
jgi:hypothetical protein